MRDIQKVIEALSSPIRREILGLIWARELPAGQIASAFSVTKPTISQHLAVLREAGLVSTTSAGTSRLYRARQGTLRGLHAALGDAGKWSAADDIPERHLADAVTKPVVVATVEVDTDQATTFAAFVEPAVYSRWMGVPVTIEEGRFSCTLEWGTQIRGTYQVVVPPELIVMSWDFDDANVPVPGGEMTAYLAIRPLDSRSHVEVHQLVDTGAQAEFMETAWTMVLGRFKSGVVAASDPGRPASMRGTRAKRRLNI